MSPQYGELRPTSGWDRFGSLGHPIYFQRLPRLGSVTARPSSSGRHPNFAASLNRWRHLYLAGRPSRWALAHILVGLPLGLEPSTLYSIYFFTQSLSSFCNTCPYHRNLFCCSINIILSSIPSLSLNCLLGTLSFTLTLHIHLTIENWKKTC